jgi:hypothetical protein
MPKIEFVACGSLEEVNEFVAILKVSTVTQTNVHKN